jgi:sec-independent protein translocase protein TatB
MSFSDTIFLFFLVLILFGPKKLPEIARQAGRLLAELWRASNEFKSQIENEISQLEIKKNETARSTTSAPQGSVASLGLNPAAAESIPHTPAPPATLAAEVPPPASDPPSPASTAVSQDIAANTVPASQESHG